MQLTIERFIPAALDALEERLREMSCARGHNDDDRDTWELSADIIRRLREQLRACTKELAAAQEDIAELAATVEQLSDDG